ncbi:MAG: hypothetical protein M1823_004667 [Watsoniomyces obsoletus]|nr:MAG: hypothetical protein M1823_004667 [Watsoniomyces obsoletus]
MPARSNGSAAGEVAPDGSFSRARLLPYNRRLRHLHGLSLRNLSLASLADHTRKRGPKTSSGSGDVHSEAPINTSHDPKASSERPPSGAVGTDPGKHKVTDGSIKDAPERPSLKKSAKRRSTLNWAGINPQARQKKLEDVTASRMADTWFSLHCEGIEEPVYVSEVVPLAMNPSYRFFDLDSAGCLVTRLAEMTIKIWAKTKSMSEYELLLDVALHLPSLRYIGKTLDDQESPFLPNSLLLHMSDGIYANVVVRGKKSSPSSALLHALSAKPSPDARPTSSYDALMQLSSLDDCIQDALMTQERISAQINQILNRTGKTADGGSPGSGSIAEKGIGFDHQTFQASTTESLASTRRYLAAENKQLRLRTKVRANLLESLRSRREAIARGQRAQEDSEGRLKAAKLGLKDYEISLREQDSNMRNQRRRLCEDLSSIYPIETEQRIFPLYPKNSIQYRFEYGVFLLNKDIECLMSRLGLKVLDLRHTLPNLKYLMYILVEHAGGGGSDGAAAAGSVIPSKMVVGSGAIKALLAAAGRRRLSPLGPSRMQSQDSFDGASSGGGGGVPVSARANGDGPRSDLKMDLVTTRATTTKSAPTPTMTTRMMNGMGDEQQQQQQNQAPLTFSFRARATKSKDRSLMATDWT